MPLSEFGSVKTKLMVVDDYIHQHFCRTFMSSTAQLLLYLCGYSKLQIRDCNLELHVNYSFTTMS